MAPCIASPPPSTPAVVLVVDDLRINRLLLSRMLKMVRLDCNACALMMLDRAQLNITVVEATNGAEAIKLYQKTPNLALVFLDLVMPELDGVTTATLIRAMEAGANKPATPIIGTCATMERFPTKVPTPQPTRPRSTTDHTLTGPPCAAPVSAAA